MLKRMLAVCLLVDSAAWILLGCGSSSTPPPPAPNTGTLYTFVADAPFCDILTMRLTITGFTLLPQNNGPAVPVIVTTPSSAPTIRVNYAQLRDFSTILDVASVPEGTYDRATITLSVSQLVVYDPTQSPPSTTSVNVNLTTMTPTASIQPPLTVVKGAANAVRLELDLIQSVPAEVNTQGQVNVTPTFKLTPVTASDSQGFGEMDDLVGFVRSLATTSPTTNFIGNIFLQLLSGTGPAIAVNLTPTTQLCGLTPPTPPCAPATSSLLSQLTTGSFLEIDGFVDSGGNVVANSIEVEDRENPDNNRVAYIGFVTSLTCTPSNCQDPNANLTGFNLFTYETEPDVPFDIPVDSTLAVGVSPSTGYRFSSRAANFVNVMPNSTHIWVGEQVVVHGAFTKQTPPSLTTVAADNVYLKLQAVQGNFSPPLLQLSADNRTGAFRLTPCASLLRGTPVTPIYIFTNSQTSFINVNGLSGLTTQPSLLVKGLPFFQKQAGTTIQGVSVPAGTLVILAKQVHQL